VAPPGSRDRCSEHHRQREKESEERHDEGKRLDITGARGSLLHAITPDSTGPLPVDKW
jgi:hypothetical protein